MLVERVINRFIDHHCVRFSQMNLRGRTWEGEGALVAMLACNVEQNGGNRQTVSGCRLLHSVHAIHA